MSSTIRSVPAGPGHARRPMPDPMDMDAVALMRELAEWSHGEADGQRIDFERHRNLTRAVYPAIWAWARRAPDEVHRFGLETFADEGDAAREDRLWHFAGLSLLAAAHHAHPRRPLPFRLRTCPDEDASDQRPDEVAPCRIDARLALETTDSPWPSLDHARRALHHFHEIARAVVREHDPAHPEISEEDVLSRYDRARHDPKLLRDPLLLVDEWQDVAPLAEAAALRSELAATTAQPEATPSAPRQGSL